MLAGYGTDPGTAGATRRPRDGANHGETTDRRPRAGDSPNEFLTYQLETAG